jgi:hypothetical protein
MYDILQKKPGIANTGAEIGSCNPRLLVAPGGEDNPF